MEKPDGGAPAVRALAVAGLALAGLAFSLTPVAERGDNLLIDAAWGVLRRLDHAIAAPDDIVIVGIDEASVRAIPEPPGLWHAAMGRVLTRIAASHPRAVILDFPLPERSYDGVKPGLDRALFDGLASMVENVPFVAALNIDPRTRGVRNIYAPYLALLGESRLGLSLVARDADGVARRFSLLVPTEDGGFPTVEGRLCRTLKAGCVDGLVHYAFGKPYTYVPFKNVLALSDESLAERLFKGRIVLIGETQAFTGRVDSPVNLAAWEAQGRDTPAVVVRAQTLRTAMARVAPQEASRPLGVVLVSLAALVVLMRDWRMGALSAVVAAGVGWTIAVAWLPLGTALALAAPLATLAAGVVVLALRRRALVP